MPDKRLALVTGANQGVGFQVAKELVANGLTVLVGSRDFARGDKAAKEIGTGAVALQLDVTDQGFDRGRSGTHRQGVRPARPPHQQRRHLEYAQGQHVPQGIPRGEPREQRSSR